MSDPTPSDTLTSPPIFRILGYRPGIEPEVIFETEDPALYRQLVVRALTTPVTRGGRPGHPLVLWSLGFPDGRKARSQTELAALLGCSSPAVTKAMREAQRLPPSGSRLRVPEGLPVWAIPGAFFCTVEQFDLHFSTQNK